MALARSVAHNGFATRPVSFEAVALEVIPLDAESHDRPQLGPLLLPSLRTGE